MDFFKAVLTDTYIYMLQKRIRNKPCRLTHDLNHENAPAKFSSVSILIPQPASPASIQFFHCIGINFFDLSKHRLSDFRGQNVRVKR